jgi:hypothetical protein
MNLKLLLIITVVVLITIPKINFGQTAPTLGATSGFGLFTAGGAFDNTGLTSVFGDIGSNTTAVTGFPPGILSGTIHVSDATTVQAALDVATAYSDLNQGGSVIGIELAGQTLITGVYQTGAASTLNGNVTIDAQGDPSAIFIIRIGGEFSVSNNSTVTLINSASICNVYWQVGGQFNIGDNAIFRGTVIVDGDINILSGSSIFGRILSKAGAITLQNNLVNPEITIAPFSPATSNRCQGAGSTAVSTTAINKPDPIVYSLDAISAAFAGNSIDSATGVVVFDEAWSGTTIITASVDGCYGEVVTTHTVTVYPLPISSLIYHF